MQGKLEGAAVPGFISGCSGQGTGTKQAGSGMDSQRDTHSHQQSLATLTAPWWLHSTDHPGTQRGFAQES